MVNRSSDSGKSYLQEFCDRCETCRELSRYKERCNAYEGALTY